VERSAGILGDFRRSPRRSTLTLLISVREHGVAHLRRERELMRLTRFAICLVGFATSASAQAHTIVALSHSDHTVNELDPVSGKVLHKFTAADQPHEGVASPDGKTFYAAVPNGPHVVILETAGFTETARIESPFFKSSRANGSASPHGVALTGDGSKLYVGLENADIPGIVVYDT